MCIRDRYPRPGATTRADRLKVAYHRAHAGCHPDRRLVAVAFESILSGEPQSRNRMGTRLYVGNLSFHSTADAVRTAFAAFGEVVDVHLVTDRETGQARGFGFVTMGTEDQAQKAIAGMNG